METRSPRDHGGVRPRLRALSRALAGSLIAAVCASLGACKEEPAPRTVNSAQSTRERATPQPSAVETPSNGMPQLPPGHPEIPRRQPALPPGHPPIGPLPTNDQPEPTRDSPTTTQAATLPVGLSDEQTVLEGITLTVPDGWKPLSVKRHEFAMLTAKAAFRLSTGSDDRQPIDIRVTQFPNMRDMPNMVQDNLDRWYGMFTQPDGRPTSEVATVETFEVNGCRITIADIPGSAPPQPNQRMIGAIIEHPKGPFFIKAMGPAAAIERWKPSILAYVRSARSSE